ncbi:MAG TPA: putative LPS assembly protein LptD, partial [Pyrinomonadaceae bacterium]|nr:putative LPS assembly protein LptD [Pyrinomonadaceae bacterium]
TIVVINAEITACEDNVPKWSFRTRRAEIKTGDRVRIKTPTFRIRGVPILFMPYASVSLKRRDRASGFLTPTFSGSGSKGFRLSNAYYQTLGRSADATLRSDIYTGRGLGFGLDVRTRANSRSFLNFGFTPSRIASLDRRRTRSTRTRGAPVCTSRAFTISRTAIWPPPTSTSRRT